MSKLEPYLAEKVQELIWSMSDPDTQGYSGAQIARMFNMPKSTAHDIIKRKPLGWKAKWVKVS